MGTDCKFACKLGYVWNSFNVSLIINMATVRIFEFVFDKYDLMGIFAYSKDNYEYRQSCEKSYFPSFLSKERRRV
jgi:hypothetical protein